MANEPQHHGLKQALNEGIKSLHKWYSRVDGALSLAYFICLSKYLLYYFTTGTDSQLVLDPNCYVFSFPAYFTTTRTTIGTVFPFVITSPLRTTCSITHTYLLARLRL
jgi:hypothetical protein